MNRTKLLLVGGFLGAGKTSLLWRAANLLRQRGERVGLITNDQAAGLVDTAFLEGGENLVREVSGSCFCCNFPGFAAAISSLAEQNGGGVIVAEPVGSCTDLSATLMQPLKEKYAAEIDLAPLTVLADPARLRGILDGTASAAAYIGEKQFEEADILLINKLDLLGAEEAAVLAERAAARWPRARVMTASAAAGEGVRAWLDEVLRRQPAGTHLAEVDYDTYAEGEAAYGWLNASYVPEAAPALDAMPAKLLAALGAAFDARNAAVGHVKFLLQSGCCRWVGNLTGRSETASLRKSACPTREPSLTVNARVELSPDELRELVTSAVAAAMEGVPYRESAMRCLIPGRPNPTYRCSTVAAGAEFAG